MKFPVLFPVSREFENGDRFVCDCVRHHAVQLFWYIVETCDVGPLLGGLFYFTRRSLRSCWRTKPFWGDGLRPEKSRSWRFGLCFGKGEKEKRMIRFSEPDVYQDPAFDGAISPSRSY